MAVWPSPGLVLITELVTTNTNLGIPTLEDGLFANLLIFDYLYYIFVFGKGKEAKRERKMEGKRKGKKERKGKGKREGKGISE